METRVVVIRSIEELKRGEIEDISPQECDPRKFIVLINEDRQTLTVAVGPVYDLFSEYLHAHIANACQRLYIRGNVDGGGRLKIQEDGTLRFYDKSTGYGNYSERLLEPGVQTALEEIMGRKLTFDREMR